MYRCSSAVSFARTRRFLQPTRRSHELYNLSIGEHILFLSSRSLGRKVCSTNGASLSTRSWSTHSNSKLRTASEVVETQGSSFEQFGSIESLNGSRGLELALAGALAFLTSASLVYLFPTQLPAHKEARCGDGGERNGATHYATMAMYASNPTEFLEHATLGTRRNKSNETFSIAKSKGTARQEPYDVSFT